MKKTRFALIGGDTTFEESGHLTEQEMREIIYTEYPHLVGDKRTLTIRYKHIQDHEQTFQL